MMRFGKSKSSNMDLPMSYQSSKDGGGRSVQIDYPAARAIKNASLYTKTSYFGMFFFLGLSFFGVRELIYSGATTTLNCQPTYCTLTLKKPYDRNKVVARLHRDQLVRSNQVEINSDEEIMKFITKEGEPNPDNVAANKDLSLVSFTLVLQPYELAMGNTKGFENKNNNEQIGSEKEETPSTKQLLENLQKLGLKQNENNEYVVIMRKYSKNKRRGTVRSQHSRLKSYIDGKRKTINIRENKPPSWQGVLAFVSGLFCMLLTGLLGQFWEEDKRAFVSRRGRQQKQQQKQKQRQQGMSRQTNLSKPNRSASTSTNVSSGYSSGSGTARYSVTSRRRLNNRT